jgi:carbon monoxide dehydrogenase subunit G
VHDVTGIQAAPESRNEEFVMATIRKEAQIDAPPERVWDALRDVGALHTRLVPGFVVDARMDGDARVVTFGNGMVAREDIVSVDESTRRVAWAIVGQQFHHYNGAAQVLDDDGRTRFVWTTDLLPDELAGNVDAMMEAGIAVIKNTMEADGT